MTGGRRPPGPTPLLGHNSICRRSSFTATKAPRGLETERRGLVRADRGRHLDIPSSSEGPAEPGFGDPQWSHQCRTVKSEGKGRSKEPSSRFEKDVILGSPNSSGVSFAAGRCARESVPSHRPIRRRRRVDRRVSPRWL